MTIPLNQSSLSDVRDQLSLDYAEGSYLNVVSANLGLRRPHNAGFSDDIWRAIVKELAVEYKSIRNKFYDVLAILYGPQKTYCTTLSEGSAAGDSILYLTTTEGLPQVGTMVLDEQLATEEVVTYRLIDRTDNAVFLTATTAEDNQARNNYASAHLLGYDAANNRLLVSNTTQFPSSGFPYPVVIRRGQDTEEVLLITGNNQTANTLTPDTPPVHPVNQPTAQHEATAVSYDYGVGSIFVGGDDFSQFPNTGLAILGPGSSPISATAGTTTSVTAAAATFTLDLQVGNKVVFVGDVTAALAGIEVTISANTDSVLTFVEALGAAPASGDSFSIRPVVDFTSIDYDEGVMSLRLPIPGLQIDEDTRIELVHAPDDVSLSLVKSSGAGWDVYQVTPRLLEVYFPTSLEPELSLRQVSYLHPAYTGSEVSTTLTDAASVGGFKLLFDTTGFPEVGTLVVDPGGANEEHVSYWLGGAGDVSLPSLLVNNHSAGETVTLYQSVYLSTDLLIGDHRFDEYTYPGPYIYNPGAEAPTGTVAFTHLTESLPGPTLLALSQSISATALEVFDASSWELASFPYQVLLGANSGNRETITVNDVNLRTRTVTELDGSILAGVTSFDVDDVSLGAPGDAADFPVTGGYRIIIGRGTANQEVCFVTSITGTTITVQSPTTQDHDDEESIQLMSDVISVVALGDSHVGATSKRSTALGGVAAEYPVFSQETVTQAETLEPYVSSFDVDDAGSLDVTGGTVLVNFGWGASPVTTTVASAVTSGDTTVTVASGSSLPVTGNYVVVLGPGTTSEERVVVSSVTGDDLTVVFGVFNDQPVGTLVQWFPGEPTTLNYSSISSNTIVLDNPIVLQSPYSVEVSVIDSSASSDPVETGYDFPFRLPPDTAAQFRLLIDWIRAAGVQVEIITQK